jgi:hypothetical protein
MHFPNRKIAAQVLALRKNANKSTPLMDRRGKHQPHNRTPDTEKDTVRQHIEFFPTVESHYTRKDTDRKYLSSNLSKSCFYSFSANAQRLYKKDPYTLLHFDHLHAG